MNWHKSQIEELISSIPAQWDGSLLKRGYEITLGKMLQSDQKQLNDVYAPYLRSANVQWGNVDVTDVQQMWFTKDETSQLCLETGDLVVCEGGDAGRAAIWRGEVDACYFQNSVNRVRSSGGNSTGFLMYWLAMLKAGGYVEIICNKATIAHLTKEKLGNLPMVFPPPSEQHAIASYLDAETARIDALIQQKTALLDSLKELRSATIFEAVFVDAPGWQRSRLKFVADGIVDTEHKTCPYFDDGKFLVVRTTNIKSGKLTLDGAKYTNDEGFRDWTQRAVPAPGDILLTREAPAGEACLVPEGVPLCVGQRTVLIQVNRDIAHPPFVLWSLYGGLSSQFIADLSRGSTVPHFNMADIGNIPLFLGPLEDQVKRADWLEARLKEIDDVTEHVNQEIGLLREMRSSTITDAVLGRIDVREHMKH